MLMGWMWVGWITSGIEVGYVDACRFAAGGVDARDLDAVGMDTGEFEVVAAMPRKLRRLKRMSGAVAWWKIPWMDAMQWTHYPDLIWMLLMLPLWVNLNLA
jgi:hypothetical protein